MYRISYICIIFLFLLYETSFSLNTKDIPKTYKSSILPIQQEKRPPVNFEKYQKLLKKMNELKKNPVKACWRQPWEEIQKGFLEFYQSNKKQAIANEALFKAGEAQESIARCSRQIEDYRQTILFYEKIAKTNPKTPLASKSLLFAVKFIANTSKNIPQIERILSSLNKLYPKSFEAEEAKKIFNKLSSSKIREKKPQNFSPSELENISWDSPSKTKVKIILEFSAPISVQSKLIPISKNYSRIEISIGQVLIDNNISKNIEIKGSLLKNITIQSLKNGKGRIFFDFYHIKNFTIHTEKNSSRIILLVNSSNKIIFHPPKGKNYVQLKNKNIGNISKNLIFNKKNNDNKSTIIIDAGHGGKDPGATHNGIIEKNITLDIALRLGHILKKNGFKVIYTRKTNKFVSLIKRIEIANNSNSNLFVSIHINANKLENICGFEVYHTNKKPSYKSNIKDILSYKIAKNIFYSFLTKFKYFPSTINNNGIKFANFFILDNNIIPSVLVEVGYCTNKNDAFLLLNDEYRQYIAEIIASGITLFHFQNNEKQFFTHPLNRISSEAYQKTI